ncbi:MAG: tyrosine-type recombinase/integrase [Rhodothermales bacterium]
MTSLRARVYLRERKSGYTAIFYDPDRNPQQKYVTLRTRDKDIARRKLTDLERRYTLGTFDPWKDAAPQEGVLLAEAIGGYLKARSDRRPKTLRADTSTLNLFANSLRAGSLVQHVEQRHVEKFLDRDLSAATLHTYHTRLKAFFEWCVDQGMIRENPMRRVPKPKLKRKEKQFLTRQQYERLLRCIEADAMMKESGVVKQASLKPGEVRWLVDVVRLGIGTGLRLGELTSLRWSAVDLESHLITVRNTNDFTTKSGHERRIPVEGEAFEVLHRLHEERESETDGYVFRGTSLREGTKEKLNDEYVSKRFLHYVRLAKLPEGLSFHSLRHTYISWMIMQGVPVPVVQKLAGHADIKTTMGYAHLAPDSLRDAVQRVFGIATT